MPVNWKKQNEWDSAHTTSIHLKLNDKTDADILAKLAEVTSKQGYIKRLIRLDIERSVKNEEMF